MSFKIVRTDKFNDQLTDIIMYIRDTFSKKEAIEYLNYLETVINNLKDFPNIGVVPRYQSIAKQGYRAIICKQNILFYKINEDTKEIILNIIVYSKRNYLNLIQGPFMSLLFEIDFKDYNPSWKIVTRPSARAKS